jgi:shikimate dehydrogenase
MRLAYENTTRKLAVIGDPVAHSLSPLIHNTMLQALGLDYVYLCQYVARGDVAAWLSAAKLLDFAGFNCTMPHKVDMVPLMDELDEDARLFGAVNTVCLREGKFYGYNTDGKGFYQSLLTVGIDPAGRNVTILGTGGAAKSVALKLLQQGAGHITVCNRTLSKAEELCQRAPERMTALAFTPEALAQGVSSADLLVNCTSLGMSGVGADFAGLDFLDALPAHAPVCDLIYSPAVTSLLAGAAERGHQTMNGLGLLVWQAIYALEQFTQTSIDGQEMLSLLEPVLEQKLH